MQKFNIPLAIPAGRALTISQPYGPTDNVLEPQGPNGEPHFHYGIDIVDGTAAETYSTPIVSPFKSAILTAYMMPPGAPNATPFIELSGVGESGNHYKLVLAHMAALFFRSAYSEGDVIALVGNRGMVSPQPTQQDPLAGSHLHLGVQVNGAWTDPLEYFDIGKTYDLAGVDPDAKEPRLAFVIGQLTTELEALRAAGAQ